MVDNDDRVKYGEMRQSVFNDYYSLCRRKVKHGAEWAAGETERAYAYYDMHPALELPIERLMLEVLMLILDAGRAPKEFRDYHMGKISEILAVNPLDGLLREISEVEKEELLYDLKILKIV